MQFCLGSLGISKNIWVEIVICNALGQNGDFKKIWSWFLILGSCVFSLWTHGLGLVLSNRLV